MKRDDLYMALFAALVVLSLSFPIVIIPALQHLEHIRLCEYVDSTHCGDCP